MVIRIERKGLYQEVADRLRDMIQKGELQPGEWVDEVTLTASLDISRTPLREALKVLVAEGLLHMKPRQGCFVNELTMKDLEEIFPLMAMLEGRCAYEAATKLTEDELIRLEAMHAELRQFAQRGDVNQYYAANARIHIAIQELAANNWLSGLINNLRQVLGLFRHRSLKHPGRIDESYAEHAAIFQALKARDPVQAEAVTRAHLLNQLKVLRILSQQDATPLADTHIKSSAATH
ncbi:GntR family transcriptional regulator [Pusillimonas sp. CC-YST705]|uniref:GntR family transcriptional regulator n=1 Tax=Mesopusillimonas faecipullorum TaxID=2755040 RepID=A0ABS8CE23_9BURK|nr:GntR family transcriptional regulator [Mesopusillimonas faecipullorum]MCB5364290.1 GntR family transcriptional regulator [Mesopusillimonas faecipullorum]